MANAVKIVETLAGKVQELAPFGRVAFTGRGLDQLEDEWAAGDNVRPTRKKIAANLERIEGKGLEKACEWVYRAKKLGRGGTHQGFEDARLAAALAAHHDHLREVQADIGANLR